MIWAALTLAATAAGAAIAAAGLLVRPTRLALPVHALGMSLAFLGGGYLSLTLREWIGRGAVWAETIVVSSFILASFILPFCVVAATVASLAMKWPRITGAASLLILVTAVLPSIGEPVANVLMICFVSALLVLPTALAHRCILSIPEGNAGRRFGAVVGWTLMNSFLVVGCGESFLMPMIRMD